MPLDQLWICEDCAEHTEGVNPPDVCDVCGHAYFDSAQDLALEQLRKGATSVTLPARKRPVQIRPQVAE